MTKYYVILVWSEYLIYFFIFLEISINKLYNHAFTYPFHHKTCVLV